MDKKASVRTPKSVPKCLPTSTWNQPTMPIHPRETHPRQSSRCRWPTKPRHTSVQPQHRDTQGAFSGRNDLENHVWESGSPDTLIGIRKNLIYCDYRRNDLLFQLSQSIDAQDFIYPPVIPHTRLYQWCCDVLESAGINTWFPEHHHHTFVALRVMRELWPDQATKLVAEPETNRRMVNATSGLFHFPMSARYMPKTAWITLYTALRNGMTEIWKDYPVDISHHLSTKIHTKVSYFIVEDATNHNLLDTTRNTETTGMNDRHLTIEFPLMMTIANTNCSKTHPIQTIRFQTDVRILHLHMFHQVSVEANTESIMS